MYAFSRSVLTFNGALCVGGCQRSFCPRFELRGGLRISCQRYYAACFRQRENSADVTREGWKHTNHVASGPTFRQDLAGRQLSSKVEFLVYPHDVADNKPLRVKGLVFVVAGIRRLAIALANKID